MMMLFPVRRCDQPKLPFSSDRITMKEKKAEKLKKMSAVDRWGGFGRLIG